MQIFWIFYFQVQKEHRKTAKVLAVLNVNRRQPQNDKATQKTQTQMSNSITHTI